MNKKVIFGVVALALLAGGYLAYTKFFAGEKPESAATEEKALDDTGPAEKPSGVESAAPSGPPRQLSMDDDPEGALILEGQVISDAGGGVGGALVTLTSNPPRTVTAQDDGSFVFDKLVGRTYYLSARDDELVGGPVAYKLTGEGDPAIIRMRAGGSLTVTVRSEATAKPLSGATVEVRTLERRTATTDENGVAKLTGIGSGWFGVVAHAPGYGRAEVALSMPSSSGAKLTAELSLGPGASVSGIVTGDNSSPVAGAVVTAHRVGNLFDSVDRRYDGAKTNEKGEFKLDAVAIGNQQLRAFHPDYAPGRSEPINVNGEVKGITIALERGGLISGVVVSKGGAPVPWATIAVNSQGDGTAMWGGQNRGTTSDDKGAFELKGLPLVKMSLLASSEGASSEIVDVDLSKNDQATGLKVVLSITGTISGKVVDAKGEELPEVQVVIFPDWTAGGDTKRMMLSGGDTTTTTGDGGFSFGGLTEGTYMLKATRDPGNAMVWQMEGEKAKTGDTGIELVLPTNGGVKGTVVSSRGEPIKNFSVTVGWPPGHPFVGDKGEFKLSSVSPGTYDLKIKGPDFADTTVANVEVKSDETKDLGTVKVVQGRLLTGRVVDSGGSAVAGAQILLAQQLMGSGDSLAFSGGNANMDEMMGVRRGTSDDDGRFRMRGIPSKALVVAAEDGANRRSRPASLPKGEADTEITLRLIATGIVKGTVRRADAPSAGVSIIATPSEARLQMMITQTDDKGAYILTKLAEGSYEISASFSKGFTQKSMTRKIEVKGGETHALDLTMKVGDITLTVTTKPEPGAKVDATQLFLFPGKVDPKNARDLYDAALGQESDGGGQSFAIGGVPVEFEELFPQAMTLCGLPITGNMSDQRFMQRLQEFAVDLKVVCKGIEITATPNAQTVELVVPQMEPLPDPEGQPRVAL